ncbi:hypothetical protein GA0070216_12817 [Micromonospora matsumotoense]|uniref:Uncharacterized protein n=1 Tax=Micromonospora matsumotoense TaxID=121616 RepID=A0A1C5AU84_9ACTN|nr:hypothetical protein [Micromonospora matsumotoense]SCF48686.1 hypothetical protein GA0070216_12817 [Micromonospora matsumotoense]
MDDIRRSWPVVAIVAVLLAGAVLLLSQHLDDRKGPRGNRSVDPGLPSTAADESAFLPFVGRWAVHGATLLINSDGSGVETWNAGPCTDAMTDPEPEMCSGHANLHFAPANAGLTGTYTKVWYTDQRNREVPGFDPGSSAIEATDTFELTTAADGVLARKPLKTHLSAEDVSVSNSYLCATRASADWHARCNA